MIDAKVTVSFFLDKSRPNADGACLIKMNVYCKPNKKRYATTFHVTPSDWEKLNGSNLRDEELKKVKRKMNKLQKDAEDAIEQIIPFSFIAFEDVFYGSPKTARSNKLQDWFDSYITDLKSKGRIGTAITYRTTINSLCSFRKNLSLYDITPSFLESYEQFLLGKNKSLTTVSIYIRELRAIINQAIKEGAFPPEKYPFRKYEIPSGRNVKKALQESDISRLLNYMPAKPDQQKALDFWILSYLCSGINFADIIELKPANISGQHLHFYRAKTITTKKKDLRPIQVGLNPRAITIIEKWKNTDPANPYLFPILEPGISPVTIKHRCQRFIKWVNKRMEQIRVELKIDQKIGTYVARHSFSTVLKRKGVSTDFIKESLGHNSVIVTENYLDSFSDDAKLEYANLLTNLEQPQTKADTE